MQNSTIWEASQLYGRDVILPNHNNPDLFSKWLDRLQDMETQLLTDKGGDPVEGKNQKYTDGTQEWGPVRWPWKAKTSPFFKDYPRRFLFGDHLTAIGCSGWDWKNQVSRWVGFDFDSIAGHAAGLGYSDADLENVVKNAPDYVDVIKSTRGGGNHFYIHFDEPFPKAVNHDEHKAIARSLIGTMSADAGFNFKAKMDVCGLIMWIWSVDTTPENQGYLSIAEATRHLTAHNVPPNWRDHIELATNPRLLKVRVRGWTPEGEVEADVGEGNESTPQVPLDEVHKRFLSDLEDAGFSYHWVHDHYLAQAHTRAIKIVHDAWREAGHPVRGPFDTISDENTDKDKPNCYMRPRYNGGWDVYRFGTPEEHPLWDNINGKTHIAINIEPSIRQGALAAGGHECADPKNGYQLQTVDQLHAALEYLGSSFRIPDDVPLVSERTFTMKQRKDDSRIIIHMERKRDDRNLDFVGWEKKNASTWQKLLTDKVSNRQDDEVAAAEWDGRVRVIKTVSYSDTGNVAGEADCWVLRDKGGKWVRHPKDHIVMVINRDAGAEAPGVLASAIDNAWTRVNKPFEPEYPGNREWNYDAAQLVYQPRTMTNGELPCHPHWDLVFNHCGADLDKYVTELDWCKEWGIKCGGDYLKAWVAAMIRYPYCRLPYLFMFSEANNTGKTTWHETVKLLLTKGVDPADNALTSQGNFNGELANTILGTIDETDITKAGRNVYNKIKDWTTALIYAVRCLYRQTYTQPNILHLVQTANSRGSCPVHLGDSRITVMEVPVIKERMGKKQLAQACRDEAPDFMTTLMSLQLPDHSDRLRVPVIETDTKAAAIEDNRDELESFLQDQCSYVPGECMKVDDFYSAFMGSVDTFSRAAWPKDTTISELPNHFPVGRYSRNVRYVGNIVLGTDIEPTDVEAQKFVRSGPRLILE